MIRYILIINLAIVSYGELAIHDSSYGFCSLRDPLDLQFFTADVDLPARVSLSMVFSEAKAPREPI